MTNNTNPRFAEKVALVTGGGSGIGAAISCMLARDGATVYAAQRSPCDLENIHHIPADLSIPEDCERIVDEVAANHGRLDILVNNAGMMLEAEPMDMELEDWNRTIMVNLTAPFLLIKHALPKLTEHSGSIVNIGSIEGLGSNPGHSAYGASKAGLHGLTRAVAVDCGKHGVRCNAVAPGWIDTELNRDFVDAMPDPESFRADIGKIHPLGRTGQPEEVAALVCWLASDEAGFITGQVYTVDGGRMARLSLPGQ